MATETKKARRPAQPRTNDPCGGGNSHQPVILNAVNASRSEAFTESKDPVALGLGTNASGSSHHVRRRRGNLLTPLSRCTRMTDLWSVSRLQSDLCWVIPRNSCGDCHPERSECFAKRSIHGVEGPHATWPRHGPVREFPPRRWRRRNSLTRLSRRGQQKDPSTPCVRSLREPTRRTQDDRSLVRDNRETRGQTGRSLPCITPQRKSQSSTHLIHPGSAKLGHTFPQALLRHRHGIVQVHRARRLHAVLLIQNHFRGYAANRGSDRRDRDR